MALVGGRCGCNSGLALFVALSLPMSRLDWTLSMARLTGILLPAMHAARLNLTQALRSRMIGSHLESRNLPVRIVCGRRGIGFGGYKVDLHAVIYPKF
jgi:hypothetical protein